MFITDEIDVPAWGRVTVTAKRLRHKRGKYEHRFWTAVETVKCELNVSRSQQSLERRACHDKHWKEDAGAMRQVRPLTGYLLGVPRQRE